MIEEYHKLELLQKVCEQIIRDHSNQDYTSIDELFKNITSKELESFLSELVWQFNYCHQFTLFSLK